MPPESMPEEEQQDCPKIPLYPLLFSNTLCFGGVITGNKVKLLLLPIIFNLCLAKMH